MDYFKVIEALKNKFDDVRIFIEESKNSNITVKMGQVEDVKTYESIDHFITVSKDNKSFTYRFAGNDIEKVTKDLIGNVEIFEFLQVDECRKFPEISKYDKNLFLKDSAFDNLTHSDILNTALEIEANAFGYSKFIKNVRYTNFSISLNKFHIIDSSGCIIQEEKTNFSGSTYVVADNGKEQQSGYDFDVTTHFTDFDYGLLGKRAAKSAVRLLGAKKLSSEEYFIVFENSVMAEFLELLEELVNAENILKNKSIFKDKLGYKIGSEKITLIDNSKIEKGVGSYYFDDEGVIGGETVVIENGTLKSYLHNSYTSNKLNMQNTGNASLNASGKMGISSSNFILQEGDKSFEDVSMDFDNVLYITDVMGMHMADTISGEFSVGVSGLFYKKGEFITPFKEMVFTANLKDLLNNIIYVFDDVRDFGGVVTPTVMFDKFKISGN